MNSQSCYTKKIRPEGQPRKLFPYFAFPSFRSLPFLPITKDTFLHKKILGRHFFTQMIVGWNKHHLLGSAETEWKEKYQTHKKITPLKQPGNINFRSCFTKRFAPRSGWERCFPASCSFLSEVYHYYIPATRTRSRTNISWATFFSHGWQLGRTNIINWVHLSLNGKRNTKFMKIITPLKQSQNMNFRSSFTKKKRPEGRL